MPSLRIAPPALRSSTISSGLPQWSVASLAPWWQGWSQKWWFVLGLDLLPEQWSCWPCWLLVFHHSPWGGCTWKPTTHLQGFVGASFIANMDLLYLLLSLYCASHKSLAWQPHSTAHVYAQRALLTYITRKQGKMLTICAFFSSSY